MNKLEEIKNKMNKLDEIKQRYYVSDPRFGLLTDEINVMLSNGKFSNDEEVDDYILDEYIKSGNVDSRVPTDEEVKEIETALNSSETIGGDLLFISTNYDTSNEKIKKILSKYETQLKGLQAILLKDSDVNTVIVTDKVAEEIETILNSSKNINEDLLCIIDAGYLMKDDKIQKILLKYETQLKQIRSENQEA